MSSEKADYRAVRVAASTNVVITDFENKDRDKPALLFPELGSEFYASLELSETELQLTGEAFVTAARAALLRSLGDKKEVLLYRNRQVPPYGRHVLGMRFNPEVIELKDRWLPTD